MSAPSHESAGDQAPLLRVLTPSATPEEIAAIVAVVTALANNAPGPAPAPQRTTWARPQLRTTHAPGPGAWRTSALPQ